MTQGDPGRILIVGGDARAHALAWILGRSPTVTRIDVAPGNGGTAAEPKARNVPIGVMDIDALVAHALAEDIGLTVISPEDPLAVGIVDRFRDAGLAVFGPTAAAARLESSKAWARAFMVRHRIPSPDFEVARDLTTAEAAIRRMGGRCVVKADGLAAGKGVVVADSAEEAMTAARAMLVDGGFGAAGEQVLIEERLEGPELSVMAITDGVHYRLLPLAQDHKRLMDGDTGPNTGGMGSYAPVTVTPKVMELILKGVVEPTLRGMRDEGHPFSGCLFCGLMLTASGPKVIEFNSRMGDPETQVQLPLLTTDLADLLRAAAEGRLGEVQLAVDEGQAAVCVVLASAGYPESSRRGDPIRGLDAVARSVGVKVLQAGSRLVEGGLETNGGRVLSVVAMAGSLQQARAKAYDAIDRRLKDLDCDGPTGVGFAGMQWRTDIADQGPQPPSA
ncbi:MAG: phosphoribosylamine--glycine ligase [Ardenticatenia bacterium]|nr:phosphoribosylamine--glycine ligase [Ardenticatenia bacterium]